MSTTYQESLDWLYSQLPMFSRIGGAAYKAGLDTSLNLDALFGHPHRNFRSIHIAGTNGKGSVSNMIAAILQTAGYKTGLYTSPHLADFRERIRVNGSKIPRERVASFVETWKAGLHNVHPSFFELTMAMAFVWMAEEKIDTGVIEVGMGGRLDSTNIITPELCVITNISEDHTQFLGDTLEKIAGEKAGIIKSGIPVVIGEAGGKSVREVFERKAAEENTKIVFAEDVHALASCEESIDGGLDCITAGGLRFHCTLGGDYQRKNINTALCAIEALRRIGYEISDSDIVEGMAHISRLTGFYGRWTIVDRSPLTIADTGHNEAGLLHNMNQLHRLMKRRSGARLRMVVGFVADKAIDKILSLFPKEAVYYYANAKIPRALPVADLAEKAAEHGLCGVTVGDVKEAYRQALADSSPDDILYIGGSTFIVADLLDEGGIQAF